MKVILVNFIIILSCFWLEYSCARSHNITWGFLQPGDRLFYKDKVKKEYQALQKVTTDIVFIGCGRITYIKATDLYKTRNGGNVTLLRGGIGQNNVTLHLKSQRGHGFNFTIEIFGR